MPIQKYIDNTLLKPIGFKKAKNFIVDTYKMGFRGLVVDDYYFNYALKLKRHFPSTPTKLIQVLNFPMGNNPDAVLDVHPSADEYDVVLPLYYMKDNNLVALRVFVEVICAYVKDKTVKFITEENLWTTKELIRFVDVIYKVVKKRKIKNEIFIKSNTGFRGYSSIEKRLADIAVARCIKRFKFKVAGGIKTLEEAKKVLSVNASLLPNPDVIIGTSHGLAILEEEQKEKR